MMESLPSNMITCVPGIYRLMLDEKGHIIGLEILDASEKLEPSDIMNISIENLPIEKLSEISN